MEKKGYREPIKASLEEILERNAQIDEMYTSREVHTAHGFGYAVCAECYDGETDRFLKEHEPSKEE